MAKETLTDKLARQVVLGDGAMGTMLYQRGVFLNACFDELNLTQPKLVKGIHADYVAAGVDFIETNTFGANEVKLAKFGLADKLEQINTAAVKLAQEAAGDETLIAGAIGPLGNEIAPYGNFAAEAAFEVFKGQARALAAAGVDFFMLETFLNAEELTIAVKAAHEAGEGLPIVALITVNQHDETPYGQDIAAAFGALSQMDEVTAVGFNCSIGPSAMLSALERGRGLTNKPIAVLPNAGLPREIDGRKLYMSTPEYMAEYAKRFFEKGAQIIGGCCGTTPEHIAEIVKAVRALDKAGIAAKKVTGPAIKEVIVGAEAEGVEPIALGKRSRIGAKLAAGEMITTIEVTPPRGYDLGAIVEKAKLCAEHGVDAINIPDGPRASSRLSPMVTAIKIEQSADIETILHVCCRDRNIIGMQSDMLGAYAIGLRNVLIITGDPPKLGEFPDATAVFDLDAIGLTKVVDKLNRGLDIADNSFEPPLGLTIAVGANPVASDMAREITRFKQKVEAGAEYAITQPVFDPQMLLDFMEATKSHAIPFVAGIWPFTSYKNAEFMANEVPGVVVPGALLERMSEAKTREEGRVLGVRIAQEMMETIRPYVAGFAVSAPFGNVKIALAVLGKIDVSEI
ncbi:MAG: bifunctional homocysteine S-methyltransferase/methylenetetrahydrofolate reductase [Sedimentisphaerales bacterium]|nr:bifunctional homocysteine S-methyltransferase/methylenetetrahydrofolate reductase [Sedimentisphaerales bacterium]